MEHHDILEQELKRLYPNKEMDKLTTVEQLTIFKYAYDKARIANNQKQQAIKNFIEMVELAQPSLIQTTGNYRRLKDLI